MRKLGAILSMLALSSAVASAGGGFGVFGSYWDMEDSDDASYGGGIRLQADINEIVGFDLRISGLTGYGGEEADNAYVAPIEAGLTLGTPLGDAARIYVGAGAGYYVLPEFETEGEFDAPGEVDVDFQDEFGFFGLVGIQLNLSEAVALFVEGKYTWLEVDEVTLDGDLDLDLGDDPVEFTGFGINAGLLFRF